MAAPLPRRVDDRQRHVNAAQWATLALTAIAAIVIAAMLIGGLIARHQERNAARQAHPVSKRRYNSLWVVDETDDDYLHTVRPRRTSTTLYDQDDLDP